MLGERSTRVNSCDTILLIQRRFKCQPRDDRFTKYNIITLCARTGTTVVLTLFFFFLQGLILHLFL